MGIEVATGDLQRALTLLNGKDDEPVRLALTAGFGVVTVWRGCWESVIWGLETQADGPTATVPADQLRAAADRPMISTVEGLPDGGVRVGDTEVAAVAEIEAAPVPSSLLGGADLALPPAGSNPYAPTLADVDQGASKVWLPLGLMQRLRLRQISRVRLFSDLGRWYVSGATVDDTHVIRVAARVALC
jgi:hypothetical protein